MAGAIPFLPAGTTLPPLPYLVAVLLAAGAVGVALRRRPPRVTGRHVLALAPWIALGSAAHVLYVVDALPAAIAPLAGSPTVYLTVGSLAGASWLALANGPSDRVPTHLATAGALLLGPVVAVALATGVSPAGARWSAVALAVTVPVAAGVWTGLTRLRPEATITGWVGVLAVFGHALDGISTAVGTTQLGFGERTPLSRILLEIGSLPSVPVIGTGWLFVLVKLAVASLVVWLFAEYVRDEPAEGFLLLGFVGAVGLGPAAHNLLLFTIAG